MHRREFLTATTVALAAGGTGRVFAADPSAATLNASPERPDAVATQLRAIDDSVRRGPFKADWDSLTGFRVPDWYRDAKFGVFIHWGLYSVPAFFDEWYPHWMYVQGHDAFEYHRAAFGPQDRFGYKDFIPLFKAERFDAGQWMDLFARAGARYVVPVGEHCDGFPMYDCSFTKWNAAAMGPKRDVLGEIRRAALARNIRFGTSSHRAEHWWWYDGGRHFPSDVTDPRFSGLYGDAAPRVLPADPARSEPDPTHLERWYPPSRPFMDDWLARTSELVSKYKPEFIYLDWWINHPLFEPYLRRFAAHYYNDAQAAGNHPIIAYKEEAFAPGSALLDVERGRLDLLRLTPWQSDTSVSIKSWGYVKDDNYREAKELLTLLIDVVSKNGNMLLNVGPRADGTIPEGAQAVLVAMGDWLRTNGEAIYGTRPWKCFGEGSSRAPTGALAEGKNPEPTADEIRFTRKGDVLYAMGLARPVDGLVRLKTLFAGTPFLEAPVARVELLGAGPIPWRQTATGLEAHLPPARDELPYALRIRWG